MSGRVGASADDHGAAFFSAAPLPPGHAGDISPLKHHRIHHHAALPRQSSSTGLRSRLTTLAAGSSINSPIFTTASQSASTSIGGSPRTPANSGAIRKLPSASLASSFENGGSSSVVSRKISTYLPPSPTATTGPNTGSRCAPIMISRRPPAIAAMMTPSNRAPCLRMMPSICA